MNTKQKLLTFLNALILGLFGTSFVLPAEAATLVTVVLIIIVIIFAVLRLEGDEKSSDRLVFAALGVLVGALLAIFAPNFNMKELPEVVLIVWFIALWAANHI